MIRLVTVIGHGVNLLPHFINHYSKYVDEINIVIYSSDIEPDLWKNVKKIIKNYDNVKIANEIYDRIFDWEKVTQSYNYIKSKKPNDWWVTADIDEFHLYPHDNLNKLVYDCQENGWDVARGGFIDRIGENGEFVEFKDEVSIWEQYPNAGFFRYPLSLANPNKICLSKGYIEITHGQHYAKIHGETTWRYRGWAHPIIAPIETHSVQVHHFKWDKTSIDRIKAVAEVNQEYSYSDEYNRMFISLFKSKFRIDLNNENFMFEKGLKYPEYDKYKNWNKLIKKITTI
jgi:hypothetical protein